MKTTVDWNTEGSGEWRATLADGAVVRGKDKHELEELIDYLENTNSSQQP